MNSCLPEQLFRGNWVTDEENSYYLNSLVPGALGNGPLFSLHVHHAHLNTAQNVWVLFYSNTQGVVGNFFFQFHASPPYQWWQNCFRFPGFTQKLLQHPALKIWRICRLILRIIAYFDFNIRHWSCRCIALRDSLCIVLRSCLWNVILSCLLTVYEAVVVLFFKSCRFIDFWSCWCPFVWSYHRIVFLKLLMKLMLLFFCLTCWILTNCVCRGASPAEDYDSFYSNLLEEDAAGFDEDSYLERINRIGWQAHPPSPTPHTEPDLRLQYSNNVVEMRRQGSGRQNSRWKD